MIHDSVITEKWIHDLVITERCIQNDDTQIGYNWNVYIQTWYMIKNDTRIGYNLITTEMGI